jgi:serine protease Do
MSVRRAASAAAVALLLGGVALADQQQPAGAPQRSPLPAPAPAQLAEAKSLGSTFAQVAAQLRPAVVRISVSKTVARSHRGRGPGSPFGENPFKATPFEHFFGDEEQFGLTPDDSPKQQRGMGSGVVVDARGYILTNNHVVEDVNEVKVSFVDGKTATGKVVGTDPKSDLAVIRVSGVPVTPARLGDSDKMSVGEWVIAIGNPFGLDHTVTVGVLSAKNRSGFQSGHYEDFLQTDASINPGNSGGPLVNINGEVIGINTMIAGMGTGVGFAVPSTMAKPIVDQLIRTGRVTRPYLGILMQTLTPELRQSLANNGPDRGAVVSEVQAGSPAERAGVRVGDVITAVDGMPVDGSQAVQRAVLAKNVGQRVELSVWRNGRPVHIAAVTNQLPAGEREAAGPSGEGVEPKAKLGLQLQSLTPEVAERIGVDERTKGVVVAQVQEGSPAAEAGVRPGDVVVEVDRKPVASPADASRALASARPGGHLLRLKRAEGALFVVVPPA